MATTGSQADFVNRIRAVLPIGWFPPRAAVGEASTSPILDGVLAGPASAFAAIWQLTIYLIRQTRIATSTGDFLDMTAQDYFGGGNLNRNVGEADAAYRARLLGALFPTRGTRPTIAAALTRLTGSAPQIIEPRRAADTKGIGSIANPAAGGGYGYNMPGLAYGSMLIPFQSLVSVDNSTAAVSHTAIYQAVTINLPESYIVWLQIKD